MIQIFQIIVLIFSAIVHEYMHGWMALQLGDHTAEQQGRLTLNPIAHIDLYGSVFLPLILVVTNMPFIFGYAKPVPYNPYNLKDQKYGDAKVAIAGPLGNLILAVFFGIIIRLALYFPALPFASETAISLLSVVVMINLVLMVFNLMPIPPLDGSKVIASFLPREWADKLLGLERYGMFLVLLFVIFGFSFIYPVISFLFQLITGLN